MFSNRTMHRMLALFIACLLLLGFTLLIKYFDVKIHFKSTPIGAMSASSWVRGSAGRMNTHQLSSPWKNVPHFEIHIRMTSQEHTIWMYGAWFLRGYRLNFPPERWQNSLVLGFDKEDPLGITVAGVLTSTWPFPRIVYHFRPSDQTTYRLTPEYRSIWDQFYPETYISTKFVGYAEPDTFFSSVVTPSSLFENGKPLIIGRVGSPRMMYSPLATQYLLGHDEVAHCRSYFPLIFQVQHIVELRSFIEKRLNKSFTQAFKDSFQFGYKSLCPYSVMCNYVWQYHRDEYVFRFQLSPDNSYDGKRNWYPGMEKYDLIKQQNLAHPERWLPSPRIAIHGRNLVTRDMVWIEANMDHPKIDRGLQSVLKESFCYVIGFDVLPDCCREYDRSQVFHYLYQFERWVWTWHGGCFKEQEKYLAEAKRLILYQKKNKLPVFGIASKEWKCPEVGLLEPPIFNIPTGLNA